MHSLFSLFLISWLCLQEAGVLRPPSVSLAFLSFFVPAGRGSWEGSKLGRGDFEVGPRRPRRRAAVCVWGGGMLRGKRAKAWPLDCVHFSLAAKDQSRILSPSGFWIVPPPGLQALCKEAV